MGRKKKNPESVYCVKVTSNTEEPLYLKFGAGDIHTHFLRTDSLTEEFLNWVKAETKKQMDPLYGEGNYKTELLVYQNPKVLERLL